MRPRTGLGIFALALATLLVGGTSISLSGCDGVLVRGDAPTSGETVPFGWEVDPNRPHCICHSKHRNRCRCTKPPTVEPDQGAPAADAEPLVQPDAGAPQADAGAPQPDAMAPDTMAPDTNTASGGFVISTALSLDKLVVTAGDTQHGAVTYTNTSGVTLTIQSIVIAERPPNGSNSGGPYLDMEPSKGFVSVPPGGTVTLSASRTFTSSDPLGSWWAYATFKDADGVWHDGPSVFFTVEAAVQPDAGTTQPDAGVPQPDAGAPQADSGGSVAHFNLLPPGSTLPSGAACAKLVRRSSWEPRPENYDANHTVVNTTVTHIGGANSSYDSQHASRVDGNFTGTTDEILQWAACKWGIDEDLVRAMAVKESWWRQSAKGDHTTSASACANIGKPAPCYQSYGIVQIKGTVHKGTYPYTEQSTAFAADYGMAGLRACLEGKTYLGDTAGDLWGCVGAYFSGGWYTSGGIDYAGKVKTILAERTWEKDFF